MTVVAVLVVLLIAAFFLGRYISGPDKTETRQPVGEPIKVLLGEFKNLTGQERFDASVAELFRTSLEQSEAIRLLSSGQIREGLKRMERPLDSKLDAALGAELAQREGAQCIIVGNISRIGSKYSISAQVVRPEDQVVRFTRSTNVDDEEGIISAIQTVGNEIRTELGESAAEIERDSKPLEKVTTSNFEALRAYTIGSQKYQEGLNSEAASFLERALELDPGFAMAHAKLVAIYSAAGDRAKAIAHSEAAQPHRDRLTEVEKFYIDGWTYRWKGTPQDVIENWSKMSTLHPKEFAGHRNLGLALWLYQNDLRGAAQAFEKAVAIDDPRKAETAGFLGLCLLGSGQTERAGPFFEISMKSSKWPMLSFLEATNRQDAVRELVREISPTGPQDSINLSLMYVAEGDLEKAESQLKQGLLPLLNPEYRGPTDMLLPGAADLAAVLYFKPDRAQLPAFAEKIRLVVQPWQRTMGLSTERSPLTLLTLLGKLLARTGNPSQARKIAESTAPMVKEIPIPLWVSHQKMLEAEILMADSKPEQALTLLDTAISGADLITIRESYAVCLEQLGEKQTAISEWRKIADSRQKAFAEGYLSSYGRAFAVLSCNSAPEAIRRLTTEASQ